LINIGDVYWIKLNSEFKHPNVVIKSESDVVTVCAITSNQNKLNMPGNVVLDPGEGNLEKQSIVEVAKVNTIYKDQLGELIGTLSLQRVEEIKNGIDFLERTYFSK